MNKIAAALSYLFLAWLCCGLLIGAAWEHSGLLIALAILAAFAVQIVGGSVIKSKK